MFQMKFLVKEVVKRKEKKNCHFYAPGEKGFKYDLDRIISQKFL